MLAVSDGIRVEVITKEKSTRPEAAARRDFLHRRRSAWACRRGATLAGSLWQLLSAADPLLARRQGDSASAFSSRDYNEITELLFPIALLLGCVTLRSWLGICRSPFTASRSRCDGRRVSLKSEAYPQRPAKVFHVSPHFVPLAAQEAQGEPRSRQFICSKLLNY